MTHKTFNEWLMEQLIKQPLGAAIDIDAMKQAYLKAREYEPKPAIKCSNVAGERIAVIVDSDQIVRLTPRETECVRLWLGGKTQKQMASMLGLSYRTIEYYFKNMRKKLAVATPAQMFKAIMTVKAAQEWAMP